MVEYQLVDGHYVCYLNGKALLKTEQVVLLVDQDAGVLLKHGALKDVQERYDIMRLAFSQVPGVDDLADDLVLVEGPREIEELNQLLQCTGYLPVYLKKLATRAANEASAVLSSFTLNPVAPARAA
jgi:hypothetical protein